MCGIDRIGSGEPARLYFLSAFIKNEKKAHANPPTAHLGGFGGVLISPYL